MERPSAIPGAHHPRDLDPRLGAEHPHPTDVCRLRAFIVWHIQPSGRRLLIKRTGMYECGSWLRGRTADRT